MENRPVPVWTWEIPTYFFVGGAAGAAALVALAARLAGLEPALVRDARALALAGAALSPLLLISDLGRPARFLNMLRVFKLQSPMSVGAWTLVVFSTAALIAAATGWLTAAPAAPGPLSATALTVIGLAADIVSALSGLVIATYTGVLIGATVIPAWSQHARWLPLIFGASALGSGVSILELLGHWTTPLNLIGLGAAAMETLVGLQVALARRRGRAVWPSRAGRVADIGALLTGLVPLLLRAGSLWFPALRLPAAIGTIVGALMTRIGWISAGRARTS